MSLTYRQLLQTLERIPDASLDATVTIFDGRDEEYYPVNRCVIADEHCQVLDEGHLYMTIE